MVTIRELRRSTEVLVFHYFSEDDDVAVSHLRYLVESGRSYDMGKGRAVLFHRAHIPQTQDHLHFLQKGNKLYALNRDGTAHDASHGKQMHGWAMDAVKQFPGFQLPPRGLIESQFDDAETLVQALSSGHVVLDPDIIRAALNLATLYGNP